MALQNSPGMFQGSTGLNPLPYVNIATQARNRAQARQDALDKYYEKLPDTINDKGLRDQEVPIIEQYKKDIYSYGIQNREALRKGDVAAKLGLDQMIREAASVARKSQNAAKRNLERGKMYLKKENQFLLNNDAYLQALAAEDLAVNDPNFREVNDEQFLKERPFDEATFTKDIKGKFQYDKKSVRSPDQSDPNYEFVTEVPVLSEKTKEQMVSDAADRFHNDPSFRKKIANDLAGTGMLDGLVNIAKEQFGLTDPTEITDELIAAAYTYSKLPVGKIREEVQGNYTNREAGKMKDWKEKQRISFDYWLTKNGITSAQKDRRMALTKNNQTYEIDDVPKLLKDYEEKVTIPLTWTQIQNGEKPQTGGRIYLDKVPVSWKSDLLGKNTPFVTDDNRQYVDVNPDGSYKSKTGVILPKDVYLNTIKRSTPWEKPEGTGKVEVRGNATQPAKKNSNAAPVKKGKYD